MEDIERKYMLTKVARSDYLLLPARCLQRSFLLPSNDGQTLWRIVKGTENDWQAWQRPLRDEMELEDLLAWDNWKLCDASARSRDEAIQAALNVRRTP